MQTNKKNVEGGSPAPSGPENGKKHKDDSKNPSKVVKEDAINNSEKDNVNGKKGYNELPPDVPVKSAKKKAE
jgi:hypothetical protein